MIGKYFVLLFVANHRKNILIHSIKINAKVHIRVLNPNTYITHPKIAVYSMHKQLLRLQMKIKDASDLVEFHIYQEFNELFT